MGRRQHPPPTVKRETEWASESATSLAGAELLTVFATDTLNEFDAMLARMQTPEVRSGTEFGFRATPSAMGKAAQGAAHRVHKG